MSLALISSFSAFVARDPERIEKSGVSVSPSFPKHRMIQRKLQNKQTLNEL